MASLITYMESGSSFKTIFILRYFVFSSLLEKVFFLSFLAFPARISKFQAISINRSSFESTSMILMPSIAFVPKNNTHSFVPQPVKIPSLPENEDLCPVTFMKLYLDRTEEMAKSANVPRPDHLWVDENLKLLSTNKFRSLFKTIIYKSDPSAQACNPHSMRSIAASSLEMRGLNLLEISKAMNWSSPSTYVRHYAKTGSLSTLDCVISGVL